METNPVILLLMNIFRALQYLYKLQKRPTMDLRLGYGPGSLFIVWSTVISDRAIFGKAIYSKVIYGKTILVNLYMVNSYI